MSLRLDWCSHEAAKYAVEHWHYSRCMPNGKLVKVGVWEDERFIGAVIYGLGATPMLCRPYGLKMNEVGELVRVALTNHKASVSKIIAISLKILRKFCPGLCLVVSFADTNEGHHGGIYQAGNWIYSGRSESATFLEIDGKLVHPRQITRLKARKDRSLGRAKKVIRAGKHRYLMPLTDVMRTKVVVLSKPYPKRAGSKVNVATADQAVEGGAIPTPALQPSDQAV